ncbi:mediator complex subunit [Myotisia sp. PD_48]|nr:mediator complex subunit [Myotisia sp. PD_48]
MEESLDVDDLFEGTGLELSLAPTVPTTKGLPARLDELRLLGCCQKIAWSRFGAIAYISADASKVYIRNLICRSNDGQWVMSEEDPMNYIAEAQPGHSLVHLSWNEPGTDLAVVDSCGRILIVNMSVALNVLVPSRLATLDSDDDGNHPVGLMWFSMNRQIPTFSKAVKTSGRWTYVRYLRRPTGPFHPLNKSALICVTRSGNLRLLYQTHDGRWGEITQELRKTRYTEEVLTHAALSPVEGGIIALTYSTFNEMRFYRLQIKWEGAQTDQSQRIAVGIPSIYIHPMQIMTPITVPLQPVHSVGDSEDSGIVNLPYSLTHLMILPGVLDPSEQPSPPSALAIFSLPLNNADDRLQTEHLSIIVRWEFCSVTPKLHPSFENITSKNKPNQIKPRAELRRREDLYLDKYVVSVDCVEAGMVIAITLDDGSVSFYNAKNFDSLRGLEDMETVISMAQAGFNFPVTSPAGIHIAFSPSGSVAATLDEKSRLQMRVVEHSFGAEDGLFNDGKFSRAMAALAMAYCRASAGDCNNDDILMIVTQQLATDSRKDFVNEVFRAFSMNVDFTVEQEKLMNNSHILKCFSTQAALGFKDRIHGRDLAAAVPWVTLQLRQISILLAYFLYHKGGGESECHDPYILRVLLGNVKWALDLGKYILDDLFELADSFNSQQSSLEPGGSSCEHIPQTVERSFGYIYMTDWTLEKAKQPETLSILLVLTSIPRSFLRYICRGLRGLVAGLKNATNLSNESYMIFTQIVGAIEASPLKVDVYEKFLASADNVIKHTYQTAGFTNSDRSGPERDLLITGTIPPVLQPAVTAILTKTVPMIWNESNPLQLALLDYSWLSIGDDERSEALRRKCELDILRKVLIPIGQDMEKQSQPSRRCVRCCSVSEDVPPKSQAAFRMLVRTAVFRSCICGGMWTMRNADGLNTAALPGWKQQ